MKRLLIATAMMVGCSEISTESPENGGAMDAIDENAAAESAFDTESIVAGSALAAPVDLGMVFVAGDSEGRLGNDNSWTTTEAGAQTRTVSYTFSTPRNRPVTISVSNAGAVELQPTRGSVIRLQISDEGRHVFTGELDGTYRLVIAPRTGATLEGARDPRTWVTLDADPNSPADFCIFGNTLQRSEITRTTTYEMGTTGRGSLHQYIGAGRTTRSNAFVRVSHTLRYDSELASGHSFWAIRFLENLPSSYTPYPTVLSQEGSTYQRQTLRGQDGLSYEYQSFGEDEPTDVGLIFRSGSNVPVFAVERGRILGCSHYLD